MKKIRMGLMAIAALTGVSSAFAFNHPVKRVNTMYYAYKDGSGVQRWTINQPSGDCSGTSTVACTITSSTPQATVLATTNAFPANATVQGGLHKIYQ